MGFIKFVLWTSLAVGLGIFLASFPIGGKTPIVHAERAWKHEAAPRLETVKEGVTDALDDAKDAVASQKNIRERHSQADRDEVNRLISKRSPAK